MKLTNACEIYLMKTERLVLRQLIENARASDSEIAKKLKLTPQAVGKIRKKLEQSHIKQYRTVVDYEALGITVFAIAQVVVRDTNVLADPHIIGAFQLHEAQVSHLLILGFPSVKELDAFCEDTKKQLAIQKINVISNKSLLKNSPDALIHYVLNQKQNKH